MAIADSLEVGQQLAAQQGTWTDSPIYTRQWLRDGAAINGATSPGYMMVTADIGSMIGCTVTATNAVGSVSEDAEPVGPVVPASTRSSAPPRP